MMISAPTPDELPDRCPVCGETNDLEFFADGDVYCYRCGRILRWLRDYYHADLGVAAALIRLATTLRDLGGDSLDIVEMVMEFEEEFELVIPDTEVMDIVTVADLIRAIRRHMGGTAA